MTVPHEVGRVFDAWAAAGRAEGMEKGHLGTARSVLEEVGWGAGQRVLDLGCGNGWAAAHAVACGADAVGVDLSPRMLLRAAGRGVAPVRADMSRLPFHAASFHHVWSMEALYYAPDPDGVLQECLRVLRPGGAAWVLLDHFAENEESHGWPEMVGVPMALRSMAEWEQALRDAGFADVSVRRLGAPGQTLLLGGTHG